MSEMVRMSAYRRRRKNLGILQPNKRVGQIIRNYRNDNDLSQRILAEEANKLLIKIGAAKIPDKSAISRIESGERELKYLESLAIAKVLQVNPEELWVERRESMLKLVA
jgi:transcriptional regulator with XRE-family HTH domain